MSKPKHTEWLFYIKTSSGRVDPLRLQRARARIINAIGKESGLFLGHFHRLADRAKMDLELAESALQSLRRDPYVRRDGTLLTVPHAPRGGGTSAWLLLDVTNWDYPAPTHSDGQKHWLATKLINARARLSETRDELRWSGIDDPAAPMAIAGLQSSIKLLRKELTNDWDFRMERLYPSLADIMKPTWRPAGVTL